MVNLCPTVTIRETYDLSTKQGKMTLIGIHTPTRNIISRLYPGFCEQYKMVKILHQNVRVASASRLPVDPLGIGVNAEGTIAPEDMFNPILYKAVSNQSLSNLEYRIRGLKYGTSSLSVRGESVDASNENVTGFDDEFDIYYSLLSNTRGWKVAHPQRGLSMSRLRPLVFEKWYNEGVNRDASNYVDDAPYNAPASDKIPTDGTVVTSGVNTIGTEFIQSMRGRSHRMPAFNTKYLTAVKTVDVDHVGTAVKNGMQEGNPQNAQSMMPFIPCVYTGLILVPPSRTTTLYYRMVVETVIRFYGVQTMDEIGAFDALNSRTYFPTYWNDYRTASKDTTLKVEENTVTASEGSTLTKRMES